MKTFLNILAVVYSITAFTLLGSAIYATVTRF